jgi:hypothetical protein
MPRGVMVWATRSDLLRVLQCVEDHHPLCYRLCGAFDSPDVPTWGSASAITALGVAREGRWNSEDCYPLLPQSVPFALRTLRLGLAALSDDGVPRLCAALVRGEAARGCLWGHGQEVVRVVGSRFPEALKKDPRV